MEQTFEDIIRQDLHPDGIREFNEYPTVSFGWMMYIGMFY